MLTVLLATRNRSRILRLTLSSFCELQAPKSGWKLVVADNGSSDDTEAAVREFSDRLPVQFVVEPQRGKNFALNTALSALEGELAVFTDDDVLPKSDWLFRLQRAADAHPEFAIFGGQIEPFWEIAPPDWTGWIDRGAAFAITDPAWKEGPIAANCVWGPNTAIRSAIFGTGIRFDTSIGPNGESYVQGGDTELTRRLEHLGYRAWHVHDAVVGHFVRKEQLDLSWAMRRAVRHGRGEFRLGQLDELVSRKLLFGIPRYLYRRLCHDARDAAVSWLLRRHDAYYRSRWRFNFSLGQIHEARAESRRRNT